MQESFKQTPGKMFQMEITQQIIYDSNKVNQ